MFSSDKNNIDIITVSSGAFSGNDATKSSCNSSSRCGVFRSGHCMGRRKARNFPSFQACKDRPENQVSSFIVPLDFK
jgi:hypothetical protein